MRIVIDYKPLSKNFFSEKYSRYITSALASLQQEKPQVEFVLASDKTSLEKLSFVISQENLIIKKSWPGIAGLRLWYQRQMPKILKEKNAALLLTTGIATDHAKTPQCIWLPGLSGQDYFKKKYFNWISEKLEKSINNAQTIFTNSELNKKSIVESYPNAHSKIIVVPYAVDENAIELEWAQKEAVKKQHTAGREYFLFYHDHISLAGFVNLLKAFSRFKKRQQSNIQLVIVGINKEKKFLEKLDGFKYHADVHFLNKDNQIDLDKIFSAAYAVLQPIADPVALLNSFSRQVPVVSDRAGFPDDIYKEAVLIADFADVEELANQLILIYKDERLRNELIEQGKIIAARHSRQEQSAQLWKGLTMALNSL